MEEKKDRLNFIKKTHIKDVIKNWTANSLNKNFRMLKFCRFSGDF